MVMTCEDRRGVDVVDHGGQCGALAATGGAGDQHQAALFLGDLLEYLRETELVERLDPEGDDAEHHADRAALLEYVAAETAQPRDAVSEVDFLGVLEPLPLRRGHDGRRHFHQVLVIQLLIAGDPREAPVDTAHRERADLQVQVRGPLVDSQLQQVVDMHGGRLVQKSGLARDGGRHRRQPAVCVGDVALDDPEEMLLNCRRYRPPGAVSDRNLVD